MQCFASVLVLVGVPRGFTPTYSVKASHPGFSTALRLQIPHPTCHSNRLGLRPEAWRDYYARCWLLRHDQETLRLPQFRLRNMTQISRGKFDRFPRTTAGFTLCAFDG